MDEEIAKVDARVDRVEERINAFRDHMDHRFDIITGVLQDHARQIGDLKGEVGGLKGELSGLKGSMEDLKGKVGGLAGSVGTLTASLGELRGEVGELKGSLKTGLWAIGIIIPAAIAFSTLVLGWILTHSKFVGG